MLEMKITITAEDVLVAAINNLAEAVGKTESNPLKKAANAIKQTTEKVAAFAQTVPANPTPTAPVQASGVPLSATPAQIPVTQPAAPVAPTTAVSAPVAPTAPAPVPTAAPQYTLEMIATAGSALIDAGKLDQLMALLGKFGVDSLTDLDSKHYGTIAVELRALGAKI